MSKLLLDEHPLLVMPQLAKEIGLNEAIILQQIHYWNMINEKANNNFKDGHYWTYNSYDGWIEQFPFWSKNTIIRTLKKLDDMNLVITGNYNRMKIDRTKWYRVNYIELQRYDNMSTSIYPKWVDGEPNMGTTLPEITSETRNKDILTPSFHDADYEKIFMDTFKDYFGYEHRNIKTRIPIELEHDDEDLKDIIVTFFAEYGCDDVKRNREKCSANNFVEHYERYKRE